MNESGWVTYFEHLSLRRDREDQWRAGYFRHFVVPLAEASDPAAVGSKHFIFKENYAQGRGRRLHLIIIDR